MTTHDLARKLLEGPDVEALVRVRYFCKYTDTEPVRSVISSSYFDTNGTPQVGVRLSE